MSENIPFQIVMELRKRQENTLITITEEMLRKDQDKILTALRKECVDLQTWFSIIVFILFITLYIVILLFKEGLFFIQEIL